MALDANLFAQFGPRQRTMGEYRQELDVQDANALALKTNQLGYQNALQAQADDAAYRDAAKGFTGDTAANLNLLRSRGLVKQAQIYEKAQLDAQKDRAEIGLKGAQTDKAKADTAKTQFDNFQTKLGTGMKILQSANTPQAVLSGLQMSIQQGLMSPEDAQQAISDMPQDPAGFAQWRDKQLMEGMDIGKRMEEARLRAQQAEAARHNKATEGNAAGQLSVAQANLGLRRQELEQQKNQPRGQIIETEGGFMLADPRGGTAVPLTAGGQPVKGKAANRQLTEGQGKSTAFAMRAIEAENQLGTLPADYNPSLKDRAAIGAPLDSGRVFASDDAQKYDTAKRNFIASILRKETGAAVTKPEFEMYDKMYFPQVGESEQTKADKKRQRDIALEGLIAESGPGKEIIEKNVKRTSSAPTDAYSDAEKERRYQEWKAKQK
jgi:hypothetical protein